MAVNVGNPEDLRGASVVGSGGDKLGKIDEIYLDNETSKPEWAAVKTGLFGGHISLVPMAAADWTGNELTVPFSKDMVKGAPHHDPGREISTEDERELFSYYRIPYGGDTVTATGGPQTTQYTDTQYTDTSHSRHDRAGESGIVGRDTSGPTTDEAMTRSKEQLHIGVQQREAGKARLRKFITTHTETRTVPVSHEEVVVEREPITAANVGNAMSDGDLTEEEHEVVLYEERPVVAKETVPVERVRLDTRTITGQQTVSAEVREENIELLDDSATTVEGDRRR